MEVAVTRISADWERYTPDVQRWLLKVFEPTLTPNEIHHIEALIDEREAALRQERAANEEAFQRLLSRYTVKS